MFGLLNTTQNYGLQQAHEQNNLTNLKFLKESTKTITTTRRKTTEPIIKATTTTTTTSSATSTTESKPKQQQQQQKRHKPRPRSVSSLSDSVKESKFFSSLSSMHAGMKSPTNLIEKFLKTEILNSYDNLKNYKNFQYSSGAGTGTSATGGPTNSSKTQRATSNSDSLLYSFNCLQGSYRSSCDSDFYEAVNIAGNTNCNSKEIQNANTTATAPTTTTTLLHTSISSPAVATLTSLAAQEMTIKCSKNLLAQTPDEQSPATLQNYQKLPDCENDFCANDLVVTTSSGSSSGEFNSSDNANSSHAPTTATHHTASSFYKRLSFGAVRNASKHLDIAQAQANESASDNSSSSITTTTTTNSNNSTTKTTTKATNKSKDLQRSSSASSSGDCQAVKTNSNFNSTALASVAERKKNALLGMNELNTKDSTTTTTTTGNVQATEKAQRRKLIQMISNYEQQNKLLQRELTKEKRRRNEELACVVKSLLCFESKLKNDMKVVNQRLAEKDNEICRLVRQNRALRLKVDEMQKLAKDNICDDEGVVEDGEADSDKEQLMEDCLVLEALQCINCRKQFYDIDVKESCTQTGNLKDGNRKLDDHHMTEHGSSSDDTVSSSFYGARRSVRYTSKRTSGTFRDYMRSRSMNIDDPALEQNSEENTSSVSRGDTSENSYEKVYSRTIERMHGVKGESGCDQANSTERLHSPLNQSICSSHSSKSSDKQLITQALEEDDGIFSPTQDDDFEEDSDANRCIKIVARRSTEFSEASPKQIYETSTDDWYASASDQDETVVGGPTAATKSNYGQDAVNPVLECVNQILLQQVMDERQETPKLREKPTDSNKSNNNKNSKNNTKMIPITSVTTPTSTNLPRRSSLSGRRNSRGELNAVDVSANARSGGALIRKRVHFSTKNSMVHVPRNDDEDEEDDPRTCAGMEIKLISSLHQTENYHSMFPFRPVAPLTTKNVINATACVTTSTTTTTPNSLTGDNGIVETFNYESIYSNEYEPVGSERNSSNLYVDMDSAAKLAEMKSNKKPPALPPKPANLLKFKKSLQQLDEVSDEHEQQHESNDCDASTVTTTTTASEPDYCSISEVNVGIKNVQIVAVVHKAPESEVGDLEAPMSELDVEVSTVASDETCGAVSQKTEEIEEIFADVPKLPNVAAIIAPKKSLKLLEDEKRQKHQKQQDHNNSDYLIMTPKMEMTPSANSQTARRLVLGGNAKSSSSNSKNSKKNLHLELLHSPLGVPSSSSAKNQLLSPGLNLSSLNSPIQQQSHQKRKHMPNILMEINKRMSLPNSPTTPNKPLVSTPTSAVTTPTKAQSLKCMDDCAVVPKGDLPLQAEFDWYNLDAEYGKATSLQQPDLLQISDTLHSMNGSGMLAEIHEDHESMTADEYNLDEEFSLTPEQPDVLSLAQDPEDNVTVVNNNNNNNNNTNAVLLNAAINEAVNFPLFSENTPAVKATRMRNNLENFEKFIEGSGLSTKPLPNKRKIYFSGPYV